jgi:hypothetical protein
MPGPGLLPGCGNVVGGKLLSTERHQDTRKKGAMARGWSLAGERVAAIEFREGFRVCD